MENPVSNRMMREIRFMNRSGQKPLLSRMEWMSAAALFIAFYLYLLLVIRPELIGQYQQPAFYTGSAFLKKFLNRPGGLLDYASAFLSQSFFIPWLGAAVITALGILICLLSSRLSGKSFPGWGMSLLIPLAALHSRYSFQISSVLGLVLALAILVAYSMMRPRSACMRAALLVFLAGLVHILAAGMLLFFSAMAVLFEITDQNLSWARRVIPVVFLLLGALIFPYLSAVRFFPVNLRQAFFQALPFSQERALLPASWALLILPLGIMILGRIRGEKRPSFGLKRRPVLLDDLVLFLLCAGACVLSDQPKIRGLLETGHLARLGTWEAMLDRARRKFERDLFTTVYVNLALCHAGRMSESMFTFPQAFGAAGLIPPADALSCPPMQRSDIFLKLGLINESEHWAYESMASNDDSPWTLIRLCQIHGLKNEPAPAARYARLIRRSPLFGSMHLGLEVTTDAVKLTSPELAGLRKVMPVNDFIIQPNVPPDYLLRLLEQDPGNRPAFEYLMAYRLLSGNLKGFIEVLPRWKAFQDSEIPRHFQEALLMTLAWNPDQASLLDAYPVRSNILDGFKEFQRTLSNYGGNLRAAQAALYQNFGGTYWYYFLYIMPGTKKNANIRGSD